MPMAVGNTPYLFHTSYTIWYAYGSFVYNEGSVTETCILLQAVLSVLS